MAGAKKPAKVTEDVQNQRAKKILHFLSRVPPLCGGNTESKRKQMCKYMTIFFVYIYIYVYIYTIVRVTYNHAIRTMKL